MGIFLLVTLFKMALGTTVLYNGHQDSVAGFKTAEAWSYTSKFDIPFWYGD
jgi:hypothetical protein